MSGLYSNYKAQVLGGGVHPYPDLETVTVHCGLANEGTDYTTADAYATELAAHQDWADTPYTIGACYFGNATQPLLSKTTTDGVFDAADVTFLSVLIDGAKNVDVLLHFVLSGTITTDSLICLHDAFTPVTPNGGDIVVQYHNSGLFAI